MTTEDDAANGETIEKPSISKIDYGGEWLQYKDAIDMPVTKIGESIWYSLNEISTAKLSQIYHLKPLKEFKVFCRVNPCTDTHDKLIKKLKEMLKLKKAESEHSKQFKLN